MKKFRILVVGCGWISKDWFDCLTKRGDCEIVGLADINAENARRAKDQYGLSCPVYEDLDQALEECRPNLAIDLTYVTTHREVLTKILNAGCDCIGEKPMTLTAEDAKYMVNLAQETGRFYAVMQNRRYLKGMAAMKEVIEAGKIGKVTMVCADIFVGADLRSIRNSLAKPMLMDNAVHTFDQARYLTGADAVTCYCESFNPAESKYKGDAGGVCVYRMSDDSVFAYRCVMGVDGCETSWDSEWRIVGTKGAMIWDGRHMPYYEVKEEVDGKLQKVRYDADTKWDGEERHAGGIHEMLDALAAGRKSQTDCTDNLKSISMVFAALKSAECGKRIEVESVYDQES